MRDLFCIGIVILFASIAVFGQSESKQVCPILTVNGPAGLSEPDGIITFTASLEGQNYKPKISWTVSGGEIVSGHGTMSINVKVGPTGSGNVKATVSFEGLPENCGIVAGSASGPSDDPPFPTQVDEYPGITTMKSYARLRAAVENLKGRPNDLLVLIAYFPPGNRTTKSKIAKLENYLIQSLGKPKDEFKIVAATSNREFTKVFFVPPGAKDPQP